MGCKVRFQNPYEIDWQYVQQKLAEKLNRRPHSTRKLEPADIAIRHRVHPFDPSLSTYSFTFKIPEYEREITGLVSPCGSVEILW